ncbi:hypothetical protein Fleli_3969 [Bernardetia litoralis DSM 6794]|uniref:Uncharacterized protein n=1 Tax=Bernardetia litoralis (strain ATCC 23117 / DSM 6794 / NBRC 15988 / NCIMB 1366 / Fx l1 / Sio-4) TaxID=880071 RepID=I4AQN6_BERLS|nr:STAS/SEC14 domain-containing protein [Bernardetia litoralis]AFM06271.1 hypothetical protein Fleli_3969 [Bernardetia litoralis DSM 6794]
MIIYESDYITIQYLEEHSLLERNWKPSSAEMNHEQFQHEMLQLLKGAEKYNPLLVLGDTKSFLYVILPDVQIWIDDTVYSQLGEHGVQKMAFVNSEDFFVQLSVEQSIEESNKDYEIRYFGNDEEAKIWLFDTNDSIEEENDDIEETE